MHTIDRDARGRLVPIVEPRRWNASSIKRSRQRSDQIASTRVERKKRLATTQWLHDLERRGIAELEATAIPWAAVQRWLDDVEPREAFAARRLVKHVLQVLADDKAPLRERFAARNELYARMIAAGVID